MMKGVALFKQPMCCTHSGLLVVFLLGPQQGSQKKWMVNQSVLESVSPFPIFESLQILGAFKGFIYLTPMCSTQWVLCWITPYTEEVKQKI